MGVNLRGSALTKGCYTASESDVSALLLNKVFNDILLQCLRPDKVPGGAWKLFNNLAEFFQIVATYG